MTAIPTTPTDKPVGQTTGDADATESKAIAMTGPYGTKVTVPEDAVDFMRMAGYK